MLDIHPDDIRVTICADDGRVVTSIPEWPDVAPAVEWIPVVEMETPPADLPVLHQRIVPSQRDAPRRQFTFPLGWAIAGLIVAVILAGIASGC